MFFEKGHLGGYIIGGDPPLIDPNFWDFIIDHYGIKSIVDVGCGEGHSTAYFVSKGLKTVGVEGCIEAINSSKAKDVMICHDYTTGPCIVDPVDAVWSCEFVEHVDEEFVDNFLATFNCASKYIFMTHAAPGQDGYHHVNCRELPYWQEQLAKIGFEYMEEDTKICKDVVKPGWIRLNLAVFKKK